MPRCPGQSVWVLGRHSHHATLRAGRDGTLAVPAHDFQTRRLYGGLTPVLRALDDDTATLTWYGASLVHHSSHKLRQVVLWVPPGEVEPVTWTHPEDCVADTTWEERAPRD